LDEYIFRPCGESKGGLSEAREPGLWAA